MVLTAKGGVKVPTGAGQTSFHHNSKPVWTTPAGSLGSVTEAATITSGSFQVVATDVDTTDTITYALISGELPNSVSSGTITFTGQPNNNDTIVINGNTWTFVTSGATGLQSNIGATLQLTLDNLSLGVNADVTASIAFAAYSNSATVFTIHHKTPGTGGDAFTIAAGTDTATVQTASGATLSGGGGGGVTLNPSTGAITGGAITVGETIVFTFTIEANDDFTSSRAGLQGVRRIFSIKIDDGTDPVWTTPTGLLANVADEGVAGTTNTILATDFDGQPVALTYSLQSGVLPPGLSLNAATGVIDGTPTLDDVAYDEDYALQFTIRATDSINFTDRAFIVGVNSTTFENGTGTSGTGRNREDVNTMLTALNLIYGVGTGQTGYGQTPFTNPTTNKEVSKTLLLSYRDAVVDCATHQGITLASPALVSTALLTDPKPWSAALFYDGLLANINNGIPDISDTPSAVDGLTMAVTVNPDSVNDSRTTAWTTQITQEFTVTFSDQDHARAFFNAGGQIRMAASMTVGVPTLQDTNWINLLVSAGTYIFDATDYFALAISGIFVNLDNTQGAAGAYGANDFDRAVKTNTVIDGTGRGGKGNILTFRLQFNDDHAGPTDSVQPTLNTSIDIRNVDGTPLTITAPTFVKTVLLSAGS